MLLIYCIPRAFLIGTPLVFYPKIEKTARKLKKETAKKKSTDLFGSSSSLPPKTSTPQGSPLWNKPYSTFPFFLKVTTSSPSNSHYKKYSPRPSVKVENTNSSETPEPSEPNSPKLAMNRDEAENTLKEWVTQEVNQQPLCISFPEAQNFKLKSSLIYILLMFRGLENRDPHKFLKDFIWFVPE